MIGGDLGREVGEALAQRFGAGLDLLVPAGALAHRLLCTPSGSIDIGVRGDAMTLTRVGEDGGPRATPTGSPLLRRLVINCPVTGSPTDTGLELSELPAVIAGPQLLIDCLECGQDHAWRIDDALLDR